MAHRPTSSRPPHVGGSNQRVQRGASRQHVKPGIPDNPGKPGIPDAHGVRDGAHPPPLTARLLTEAGVK